MYCTGMPNSAKINAVMRVERRGGCTDVYTVKSTCCTVPAMPFSFRNMPFLFASPCESFWAFLYSNWTDMLPRNIAPTFLSARVKKVSVPFASFVQIFNFLKMGLIHLSIDCRLSRT